MLVIFKDHCISGKKKQFYKHKDRICYK